MTILVTGGLGFIGHNVVADLEQLGKQCVVIDNRTNYNVVPEQQMQALHEARLEKISPLELHVNHLYQTTITDWMLSSHSIDTIIHLAACPRQAVVTANPYGGANIMVGDLIGTLEAAVRNRVKKFVFISSSMVYGNFDSGVREEAECRPTNLYGILKLTGEQIVRDYAKRYGFSYVIVRPSAVYGELDVCDRAVAKFLTQAIKNDVLNVNGADEILDFTHVSDIAHGIVLAATSDKAHNAVYNITRSDDREHTLLAAAELAIMIAGGGTINIRDKQPEFPSRGNLNIYRAQLELGYSPRVNIEQGFQKYYEWLKANPVFWS